MDVFYFLKKNNLIKINNIVYGLCNLSNLDDIIEKLSFSDLFVVSSFCTYKFVLDNLIKCLLRYSM